MELWIRTQKKDRLIKCQSLEILDRNHSPIVQNNLKTIELDVMIIGNDNVNLGTYTKERALEVLDEIQYLLRGHVYESHINKFDIYNGDNVKIYEMPKE